MKSSLLCFAAVFFSFAFTFAQVPNKMSYQLVVRNASNNLITNQTVGMRFNILQGSATGTSVYVETQNPTTNINGLASVELGAGIVVSGNFLGIDWANGPYFLQTETDPSGGSNYTIVSTSQLLSVPYALFSGNGIRGVSSSGDSLILGNGNHLIVPGISAANSVGPQTNTPHTCGANQVHNPLLTYGSMTDQDGHVYKTIIIGNQEWMAENLKTGHYRNGNTIPVVTNNVAWSGLNTGASSWYDNDSATYDCPYGRLYNWYAVNDSRRLCPSGWHEPSDAEWNVLIGFLDPAYTPIILGSQSLLAGGDLKSTGNFFWLNPNQDASNSSGFSALPGGGKDSNGLFGSLGNTAGFWTNTAFNNAGSWTREILTFSGSINRSTMDKRLGYYVRCVKD